MKTKLLLTWTICALFLMLGVGLINVIIDPYGLFGYVNIVGFNQQKEGVRSKIRFVKALELPLRQPKTLIIGSSRVNDAMNPENIAISEYSPVYNLGIDMARIHEIRKYLLHGIVNSNIKRVLIGLDYFMFDSRQQVNEDFDDLLVGKKISYLDYAPIVFSMTGVADSIATVKFSHAFPGRREFLNNGLRPQAFYGLKNYAAAHYYVDWIFLTPTPQSAKYYNGISLGGGAIADFTEIIRLCKYYNIDLRFYISPAHAELDGEGLVAAGKYSDVENWKRKLVSITSKSNVPLFDFSGYNFVTTEKVNSPMKYYWDSSHFNETVSNWILRKIYLNGNGVPQGFGVKISSSNIEKHLSDIQNDRREYINKNPIIYHAISSDYKDIMSGKPIDNTRILGMY